MNGGGGADTLSGAGGADRFSYSVWRDSTEDRGIDTILDFSHAEGDRISPGFDANRLVRGDQNFVFIGEAAFSGAGQLRSVAMGDGTYRVEGSVLERLNADFVLIVHADAPLVATDFIL